MLLGLVSPLLGSSFLQKGFFWRVTLLLSFCGPKEARQLDGYLLICDVRAFLYQATAVRV